MRNFFETNIYLLLLLLLSAGSLYAQSSTSGPKIYMDIDHGQKFWNDPSLMDEKYQNQIQRVKYMTDQLLQNAVEFNAELHYIKGSINSEQLADCDLLFIHIPSSQYSPEEVSAVTDYLQGGGSLFLVMEEDYWTTLEQTNVNDLIAPFGIQYRSNSPDTLSGGYTKEGILTSKPLKITYHGGRIVKGGTPFCFNNQTEAYPFGVYLDIPEGGRLVVMGDGMVSLYMTSWDGVEGYQCLEFMHEVFAWLLDEKHL